jgi:protein required for attachment to host cells
MHHKLAHGAWVFVGDGQKALFLINEGDEKFPNLRRLAVEEHKEPPSREQGSDAPGRVPASARFAALLERRTGMNSKRNVSRLRSPTGSIRLPCPARSTSL